MVMLTVRVMVMVMVMATLMVMATVMLMVTVMVRATVTVMATVMVTVTAFTNIVVDDASVRVRLVPWRNVHSQQTFPLKKGKFSFSLSFAHEFYNGKGKILYLSSLINQFYVLVMTTIMVAMMPIWMALAMVIVMWVVLSTLLYTLSVGINNTKSQ